MPDVCSWLLFTCIGICIGLLIRAALRAVIDQMTEDGRWDDDWRVVVTGDASPEKYRDLSGSQPHGVAPAPTNGAPNTGRGTIGLRVRG